MRYAVRFFDTQFKQGVRRKSWTGLCRTPFPRAKRGVGQICVCYLVRGMPKFSPFPPHFNSILLSVLK